MTITYFKHDTCLLLLHLQCMNITDNTNINQYQDHVPIDGL